MLLSGYVERCVLARCGRGAASGLIALFRIKPGDLH